MGKELTDAQVEQQDFVDNTIHNMLVYLNPSKKKKVEWDISIISEIRNVVLDYFLKNKMCTEKKFYPYLDE